MFKYRKKPVDIEAFQWTGDNQQEGEPEWIVQAVKSGDVWFNKEACTLCINTLEGVMSASQNDYIIRGILGEIYPCKPEIFSLTYEKASIKMKLFELPQEIQNAILQSAIRVMSEASDITHMLQEADRLISHNFPDTINALNTKNTEETNCGTRAKD